jgi:hypothetical protein
MSAKLSRLQKLEQQRQALEQQIRKERSLQKDRERKEETRRKILVGALVLEEARSDPELSEKIDQLIDKKLLRDDDRLLFGLEPIKAENTNQNPAEDFQAAASKTAASA